MATLTIVVQWLHVLLGIFWFGSNLYIDVVVIPSLTKLPLQEQQKIGGLIGKRSNQALVPAGIAVVGLGFLRGTFFGQLHSLGDVFGSAYGVTWLIALLLATGLIFLGLLVVAPRAEALSTAKSAEEYGGTLQQLKILTLVELAAFVAIFTCMILMRFGY